MKIAGHNLVPDYLRLGSALLIASACILAIRTARWPLPNPGVASDPDLNREVEIATRLVDALLARLLHRHPGYFHHKPAPWYQPTEDDTPS